MTITLDGTLGVTTPAETITGTLAVTGITTVAAGSAALPSIVSTTGTADTGQFFPAADTIAYSTAGTERMRIISTGYVGIGTTVPRRGFSINAGFAFQAPAGANRGINWGDETTDIFPISVGADTRSGTENLSFSTNTFGNASTERMRITSGGYVGIATTAPSAVLEIAHNGGSTFGTALQIKTTAGTDGPRAAFEYYNGGTPKRWNIGIRNSSTAFGIFEDGYAGSFGTERLTVLAGGQVMVNTTTATGNFTVASTSTTSVPIATKSPASFTTATYWSDSATAAGTGWYHFYATSSSATVQNCIIFGNGNVQNTNNSYGAISDIKLKENITDATPKLEQLNQVRVVNFNLKSSPEHKQLGVIAQELESIFPGMVDETNDRDADNNVLETKTKSVKYSVFVPMLIKAMQEQQAIIETLTARITALETE